MTRLGSRRHNQIISDTRRNGVEAVAIGEVRERASHYCKGKKGKS
ncbi:hypothetical protein [uncultured Roseobacter sp.]|nr:hypothetical protein [uncultured Roseobacter sp.]